MPGVVKHPKFLVENRGTEVKVIEFKPIFDSIKKIDENLLAGHLEAPDEIRFTVKNDITYGRET